MAKTGYLKNHANGVTPSPPLGRRVVSGTASPPLLPNFTPSLPNFRTSALPRAGFSVIELTLVIGVLSLLLAIVLPTIKTVHAQVLRNRAKTAATTLAQAAIHYKSVYGFWPGQLEANDVDDLVALRAGFQGSSVIPVIISGPSTFTGTITTTGGTPVELNENEVYQSFRRIGRKDGTLYKPNPLNPKGIHFLDLDNEGDRLTAGLTDPWGRGYVLFMGLNPNSSFTHTITAGSTTHSFSVRNTIAFAFSFGPDGENSTNYLYSAGVQP